MRSGKVLFTALAVMLTLSATPATAQLQWDPTSSGGANLGGAGSWTAAGPTWWNGATNVAWDGLIANFGGATGGAVTVDSTGMAFTGLAFTTTGYTLSGSPLAVTGAGTLSVASGATAAIGVVLTGAGSSLTYNSPGGVLTLSQANTFNGGFNFQAGQINYDANAALGATAGTVTITGGTLATSLTTLRTISNPTNVNGSFTIVPPTGVANGFTFSGAVTVNNAPTITNTSNVIWLASTNLVLNSDLTVDGSGGFGSNNSTNSGGASRTIFYNSASTGSVIRSNLVNFTGFTLTIAGTGTGALQLGSSTGGLFGATAGVIISGGNAAFSSAASTFTGGVTLNSGSVRIGATSTSATTGPLGNGSLTINGGTLRLVDANNRGFANPVTILGDTTFGFSGNTNTLTLTSDSLTIMGDRTFTTVGSTTAFSPPTSAVAISGNLTFDGSAGTITFGTINFGSAARTFTKTGTGGTVTLNGTAATNLVAGNSIVVTAGTFNLGNPAAMGVLGVDTTFSVAATTAAATFGLTSIGASYTYPSLALGSATSGNFGNTLAIGANTFNLNGNVTYDGTATSGSGVISATGATGTQGLVFGATQRTFFVGDSTGTSADLTVSAPIHSTAGFIKAGLGMMNVTSNNSATITSAGSTIFVNEGRLLMGADGALGDILAGTVVASGATLSTPGTSVTYTLAEPITINGSGTAGRLGALDQNGTSGTFVPFVGAITLGSAASIGNNSSITFGIAGTINTAGFTLTSNNTNPVIYSGPVIGGGALVKIGSSSLTLSNTGNVLGPVTIQVGSVVLGASGSGVLASTLTFDATTAATTTLGLGTNTATVSTVTIGGITGSAATITAGAGGGLILAGNVNYIATVTNNPNGASWAGNIDLNGAMRSFTIADSTAVANELTISATLTGNNLSGILKDGPGNLILSGNSSATLIGGTIAVAGTGNRLIVTGDGALGDITGGTTVASGATIGFGSITGNAYTFAEPITINGSGATGRFGALELNGASGPFTLAAVITLGSNATIGNSGINQQFTLSGSVNTAGFDLTLNHTNTINLNGPVTGTGRLIKTNTANANIGADASGLTSVEIRQGSVTLTIANVFGSGTALLLNPQSGTGSLALSTFATNIGPITISGLATTTSTVTAGVGGAMTVNGNIILDATNNPNQATIGGSIDFGSLPRTITVGDSTATLPTSSDLVLSGVITTTAAGGLIKEGPGGLGLGGGSSATLLGPITINAGRILASLNGSLGSTTTTVTVANNTTLAFASGVAYTDAKPVTIIGVGDPTRAGAIDLNTTSSSFAGPITMLGASTIGNASTTAGARLTLSGTIDNGGSLLTVNTTFNGATAQAITLSGAISGSGGFTKTGLGGLTLGGGAADLNPNTYTGLTTLSAGTLALSKGPNVVVIPGDFTFTGGTLGTITSNNAFASTTNIIQSGGTYNGNGNTQTFTSLTQTGGTFQTGTNAVLNISGAVSVSTAIFTVNSAGIITVGSFSLANGTSADYRIGGSGTARTQLLIGSGGLSLNNAGFDTATNGTNAQPGTTIVLNGNLTSTNTSSLIRLSTTTNDPSGLTGAIDFNSGTRTVNVSGTLTAAVPFHNGNLVKDGTGTLILNAINPNTSGSVTALGTITLLNGTVLVGGTVANSTATIPAGASPVDATSSSTIGGFGTVERGIDLRGTLAPGGSIGQLTTSAGTSTWHRGGIYAFEYDTTNATPVPGTDNDHFLGTGTATLDLSTLTTLQRFNITLSQVAGPAQASDLTYTIATFPTGTITLPSGITGNDLTPYFNVPSGGSVSFVPGGTTDTIVLFIPVPEPFAMIAVGGLAVLALRRRR